MCELFTIFEFSRQNPKMRLSIRTNNISMDSFQFSLVRDNNRLILRIFIYRVYVVFVWVSSMIAIRLAFKQLLCEVLLLLSMVLLILFWAGRLFFV